MHLALTVLGFYRVLAWLLRRTSIGARFDPARVAAAVVMGVSRMVVHHRHLRGFGVAVGRHGAVRRHDP
jgi:hypothetical protein